ncbi:response regulator [Rhizobium sp. XQZ8]|uniref:response regulator n=1 Tax=Rhizobium populisoli TaxID=2859785 RepID=UPI001C6708E2|nr:response regulator [Rhizobium populisoli]MBW6425197.1 response regulator [Rhizobium populisoli]
MSHFAEARILVVDDEPDVLAAYGSVFSGIVAKAEDELETIANTLFESASTKPKTSTTVAGVDLCRQGEEALRWIEARQDEKSQYPIAFIDMRIPPGINGLETAKRLRQISPDINIVVVTGYSDHPPHQLAAEVGGADRLFYLVKPFNPDELLQLATALIHRWNSERMAAAASSEREARTLELEREIAQLRAQVNAKPEPAVSNGVIIDRLDSQSALPPPQAKDVAFREGRAAYGRRDGLAFCPYSALKQPELFLSWVAGYRSLDNDV